MLEDTYHSLFTQTSFLFLVANIASETPTFFFNSSIFYELVDAAIKSDYI